MARTSTRKLILAALVSFSAVSCTRESKTSTLTIQLPQLSGQFKANNKVGALSGDDPWSGEITASSEINCYMVFVGGPSPNLSQNACKEQANGTEIVRFGPYVGGVPAGQAITMEVPSGPGRTVTLLAMQAQAGACKSFKGSGPPEGQISYPRLIATKTVNLAPGDASVAFDVPANLSSLPQVGECQVNDMPDGGGVNADQFWGDRRDGTLNIANSATAYLDGTMDNYDNFASNSHTPYAGGLPSSKLYGFNARVTNIDLASGKVLTTATDITSAAQVEPGDMVLWYVSNGWASTNPDSNACGGDLARGEWGTSRVTAVDYVTDQVTLSQAVTQTPGTLNISNIAESSFSVGTPHCTIQLLRVSQFDAINIGTNATLSFTSNGWSAANGTGGLIAVWARSLNFANAASTLNIMLTGGGHSGASAGSFGISGGGNGPAADNRGGQVSTFGGGGANGGSGATGSSTAGAAITLCGGTSCRPFTDKKAFFGGGGGGDGSAAGGNGGGAIFFIVENITGLGSINIDVKGAQTTGSRGSGAGGTIAFTNRSSPSGATINLFANGGNAGTGGAAGGGGVIEKRTCNSLQLATWNVSADAGTGSTTTATNGQVYSENLNSTNAGVCAN